ncbi:MAG: SDR family oxidoreductase [Mariniphaga sp.]|nr:SDR family oxidoreductase [Mariniphaga sp.]
MENFALITGAASGIGLELTKLFLRHGYRVVLVDVNTQQLSHVKQDFEMTYKKEVPVIFCDLCQPDAAETVYKQIREMNIQIEVLVNDAGFGIYGYFKDVSWQAEQNLIQLAVLNTTSLVKLFLDDMISRNSGKILNVASISGFVPGPMMSIYYATKSYLVSFSLALASELENTNIKVTVLCPGLTKTNFSKATGNENPNYGLFYGSPEYVAKYGFDALEKGKTLAIPYFYNKLICSVLNILPKKTSANIIRHLMESRSKK